MAGLDISSSASHFIPHFPMPNLQPQRPGPDSDQENRPLFSDNTSSGNLVVRRPRGRPPGSKNNPKSRVLIARESANTLRAHILEVSSGSDVFEVVAEYARKRQRGICVLSGNGTVNNVSLRQPTAASSVVNLEGQFDILSLSGSFLPPPAPPGATSLAIYLAGGQGQVVGGNVVGALIASGPVFIIAASFSNVAYEQLPLETREEDEEIVHIHPTSEGNSGNGGGVNGFLDQSMSLSFFNLPSANGQLPMDGVWAGN